MIIIVCIIDIIICIIITYYPIFRKHVRLTKYESQRALEREAILDELYIKMASRDILKDAGIFVINDE